MIILIPIHLSYASEQYTVPRINGVVELDGPSYEPVWNGIEPLPVIMHSPNFGSEPTERTEILIAYDDDYLYIAGRLYDSEPEKIQAPSKKRDDLNLYNDWFGLIIDSFNDKENALAFFTTPSGLKLDMTVFGDAVGDFPINPSWNAFWDVATARDERGWFAEIRIPFSSLRFQADDGRVVMGLTTWRSIARKNETIIYPSISPDYGFWSIFKPSLAKEVVLTGIRSKKALYISPYFLGGYGQSWELDDAETSYAKSENPADEVGLDVKYGLTSNLTLDITVNTDFAQVEADDQQINLTRFSLFFPEKRLFFQERASNFEFNMGGHDRLFYSRRIGIYDEGQVSIYGGAKLVGRAGVWDLGFLDMQTAPAEDITSENFGVFRVRRQVINQNTYVGGIVTSRAGADGAYNTAYGVDGIFRISEKDYLQFNWAQTFEDDQRNEILSLDPSRMRVSWERRTIDGLAFDLTYSRAGDRYNPGMGYEQREDYSRFGNEILYGWFPGEESPLYNHQLFVKGSVVQRNSDGSTESSEIEPGWQFEYKSGYFGELSVKAVQESVTDTFSLSDDVEVPPGVYSFNSLECEFSSPMSGTFLLSGGIEGGTFYDGSRRSANIFALLNLPCNLELSSYYEINWITFPDRDQELFAHIGRLRGLFMPSTKLSLSAFIQYNSADNIIVGNARLRYNPSEGRDLYLVYDECMNTDRFRDDPVFPTTNNRTILLKYTHTFRFEG
ncbi:hypothetical protein CEE37_04250 [candidate division LCP-89 bacterium B3_LCP]|uniref:DUF5916 domain-containing protein n=1 Tax=candidate division LCP-89 bacterium B3_LCP TaxID=2012998 RepID=A0A532V466_UNCL8|nr:MAG: hypothetical protein CEE37_04250 [candidate division LCP-89 bacterium B3_LCP]